MAPAYFHYAGISARPLPIPRTQLIEYFFYDGTASDSLERQTSGMQVTALTPRNDPIHQPTDFFGLDFGGTNALVRQNRHCQIRKQRLTMTCAAVQAFSFFQMAHNQNTFPEWLFIPFFPANPLRQDPCQGPAPYWSISPLFRSEICDQSSESSASQARFAARVRRWS